jgi:DNA-binding transcriptional LysR family regulator
MRNVTAATLANCKWVLSQGLPLDRRWFESIFLTQGVNPPGIVVETDSSALMKSLLIYGDFLTIIPRGLFSSEESSGSLTELRTEAPRWKGAVGITRRRKSVLSSASAALLDEIKGVAIELTKPKRAREG